MGIKRLMLWVMISILITSFHCLGAEKNVLWKVQARQMLKDYGLIACLKKIDSKSQLANDLNHSLHSLSFMGKGRYMIVQDENTLKTKYNPYKKTVDFILENSKKMMGYMKNGKISASFGCLKVYHSKAYDSFISKQDNYISPISSLEEY